MNTISAVIITYNEEKNIKRCLDSLKWVDEIVIVDSGSSDDTLRIAGEFEKVKVFKNEWLGFGRTKKLAVDHASNDWILSIDADEEVTSGLQNEVTEVLKHPKYNGYKIKRNSFYLGKQIKHCGWDNDYPLRLFNREQGNFNDKEVHESVKVTGPKGKIDAPLMHYTYPTIESHITKINRYSELAAYELIKNGKSYSIAASVIFGLNKFFKMYILKLGFLDGGRGLILCLNSAYGVFLKYIKTWKRK